jgi:hypothetical protein
MIDEETLAQMNGKYVMPSEAGPYWRAAAEYGFDMSLVEEALRMNIEQRIEQHQRALDLVLEVMAAGERHAAK